MPEGSSADRSKNDARNDFDPYRQVAYLNAPTQKQDAKAVAKHVPKHAGQIQLVRVHQSVALNQRAGIPLFQVVAP
jgi:hypothetical protein